MIKMQQCFRQTYLDMVQHILASFEMCLQNMASRPGWVWG